MPSQELSFSLKKKLENHDIIVLLHTYIQGEGKAYAYMRLDRSGLERINAAIVAKEEIYPDEYGEVIISGEGEPDEETRQFMFVTYSFTSAS